MSQLNDTAAAVWATAESVPVIGKGFTALAKIGNIPVIKKIGDAIGDVLRGGLGGGPAINPVYAYATVGTKEYAANVANRQAQMTAADQQAAATSAARGGQIDYGFWQDAKGLPHPKYPGNIIKTSSGRIIALPSYGDELGITVTTQNNAAVVDQIIKNINANRAPNAGFGVAEKTTDQTFANAIQQYQLAKVSPTDYGTNTPVLSGAADATSLMKNASPTTLLIMLAIVAVVIFFVMKKQ